MKGKEPSRLIENSKYTYLHIHRMFNIDIMALFYSTHMKKLLKFKAPGKSLPCHQWPPPTVDKVEGVEHQRVTGCCCHGPWMAPKW